MTTEQELKVALCGYFPYGLKGVLIHDLREDFGGSDWLENEDIFNEGTVWDYEGFSNLEIPLGDGEFEGWLIQHNEREYTSVGSSIKPILYPLSSLTQPIVVKGYNGGEPFVPIEEIAKIECPAIENSIDRIKNITSFNRGVSFGSNKMGVIYEYEGVVVEITHFRNGVFHKSVIKGNDSWVFSKFHNYPQIIEFLNMCLIDYRNLIGKGLAIDVTTLEINPYSL